MVKVEFKKIVKKFGTTTAYKEQKFSGEPKTTAQREWNSLLFLGELAQEMVNIDAEDCKDEGTCVLGAGIMVHYVPYRCRYHRRLMLTRAPFQGNVGSYKASERALNYLKHLGVEAYWYDGVMD